MADPSAAGKLSTVEVAAPATATVDAAKIPRSRGCASVVLWC